MVCSHNLWQCIITTLYCGFSVHSYSTLYQTAIPAQHSLTTHYNPAALLCWERSTMKVSGTVYCMRFESIKATASMCRYCVSSSPWVDVQVICTLGMVSSTECLRNVENARQTHTGPLQDETWEQRKLFSWPLSPSSSKLPRHFTWSKITHIWNHAKAQI